MVLGSTSCLLQSDALYQTGEDLPQQSLSSAWKKTGKWHLLTPLLPSRKQKASEEQFQTFSFTDIRPAVKPEPQQASETPMPQKPALSLWSGVRWAGNFSPQWADYNVHHCLKCKHNPYLKLSSNKYFGVFLLSQDYYQHCLRGTHCLA